MADIQRLPGPNADEYEWQLRAACRGMDSSIFFHPADERGPAKARRTEKAKGVCRECTAIIECRTHALRAREPYGIWGGLSEEERAQALGLHSVRYPQAAAQ